MHPSCCLISGNPSPYLSSVAPIGAAVQEQHWGEFWKFPDAFTVISSHLILNVEQGQVMLYIKQKNSVHLTVSSHCHWSRNSGGFWRKGVICLVCGKEKPHLGLPDTSGTVPPVFSRHWISPNMRFTPVMGSLPRQKTPSQRAGLCANRALNF